MKVIILTNERKTLDHFGRVYYLGKELAVRNKVHIISVIDERLQFRITTESVDSMTITRIIIPKVPIVSSLCEAGIFVVMAICLNVCGRTIVMACDPIGAMASVLLSKALRIPAVFDILDNFRMYPIWADRPTLFSLMERFIMENVDALLFASDLLKEDVNHRYPRARQAAQVVIHNGFDTELFHPMRKTSARRQLSIPDDARVVLYSGGMDASRGVMTLLRAFRYLLDGFSDRQVYLVLAGKGEALPRCKLLASELGIRDRILFLGWLPHSRIPLCVNAADITVLPNAADELTKFMSAPLKLVEFMACGKPVVATNVGGCRTILGKGGVVVPPDDPESLAQALRSLLIDPERLQALGSAARKLAMERFSWKHLGVELDRFLHMEVAGH